MTVMDDVKRALALEERTAALERAKDELYARISALQKTLERNLEAKAKEPEREYPPAFIGCPVHGPGFDCFHKEPKSSGWRARDEGGRGSYGRFIEIHPLARRWWRCETCGCTWSEKPPSHWSTAGPCNRYSEVLEISREEP